MLRKRLWLSCILLFGVIVIASSEIASSDEPSEKVTVEQLSRKVDELSRTVEQLFRIVDDLSRKVEQLSRKEDQSSETVMPTPKRSVSDRVQIQFLATGRTYAPWKGQVKVFEVIAFGVRYEEVGRMFIKVVGLSDPLEIMEVIREEAKKKGANGVILDTSLSSLQSLLSRAPLRIKAGLGVELGLTAEAIRIR